MNIDAYNRLPAESPDILQAAAYATNIDMPAKYDALNSIALGELLAGGVQL
ncbi:MAG: hypothetical protein MI924_21840 [Chloroflexales bacterium]|nr:hypothetical protein [Chloroflexales bacterium]